MDCLDRSSVEVLDLLTRVQTVGSVDPGVVLRLKEWIQTQQGADGSFSPHSVDMEADKSTAMSAEDQRVATTALTLVALIRVGIETDVSPLSSSRAKPYSFTTVASHASTHQLTVQHETLHTLPSWQGSVWT